MARLRHGQVLALALLAGGCATHAQDDDTPQSPQHVACAGEVRQMQASCNPDLLRTSGADCSAATTHIVDHCQQ